MNETDKDEQRFTGYPNPDDEKWMTPEEKATAVQEAEDNRAAWELLQNSVTRVAEGEPPLLAQSVETDLPLEAETSLESTAPLSESEEAAEPKTSSEDDGIDKEALAQAEREELLRRALEIAIEDSTSLKQLYDVVGTQIYSSSNSEKPISQVQESSSYPDPDLMMLVNGDLKKWLESTYPKLEESKKWIIYLSLEGTDPWKDRGFAADKARELRANNQEVTAETILAQLGITESDMPPALFNKFQELVSVELQNHLEKVRQYVESELADARRGLNGAYGDVQMFADERGQRGEGGFKGALPRAMRDYERLKENPWVDLEQLEESWVGIKKLKECLEPVHAYIRDHVEEIWTKHMKAVSDSYPTGLPQHISDEELTAYLQRYEQAAGDVLAESGIDIPDPTEFPDEYSALISIVAGSASNWLANDVIYRRRQGIKQIKESDGQERKEIDWDQVKSQSERAIKDGYALATSDKPTVSPSKKVTIAVSHRNYSSKYPEHAMAGFAEGSALKTIFGDQETLTAFMLDLTLDEANELFDQQANNFVVSANVEKDVQNVTRNINQKSVGLGDRFMEGVDNGFGSTLGAEYYRGPYTYNESELTRDQIVVHAAGYLIGLARRESSTNNQKLMEKLNQRLGELKKQNVTQEDVLAFAEKQYARVPGVNEGETLSKALGLEQAVA